MTVLIMDTFEPEIAFSIEEAAGEVAGKPILAKMAGEFFVPEGISRNNRFYSTSLWERVCGEPVVKKRMAERRMYGTIGHEQKLDDKAVLEGRISHIVTSLEVRDGKGYGEALILDTPAGRILNTMVRAGCKLFVSSRASGTMKGEMKGIPMVDPLTYVLETFDYVLDPGFVKANPELVESLKKIIAESAPPTEPDQGETTMTAQLLESLSRENGSLKNTLEEATKTAETLRTSNLAITEELKVVKDRAKRLDTAERQLEGFKRVANTPEEAEKAIETMEKQLEQYQGLGTFEDVSKAITQGKAFALKVKAEREDIGEAKDIVKALDLAVKMKEAYEVLGTPAQIAKTFDVFEDVKKKMLKDESDKKVKELATELRVSEDKVRRLWDRGVPAEDIREVLKGVVESARTSERWRSDPKSQEKKPAAKNEGAKNEEAYFGKSRGERLLESLTR